jgi:hypothetical protein
MVIFNLFIHALIIISLNFLPFPSFSPASILFKYLNGQVAHFQVVAQTIAAQAVGL